jgi:arylformamidase
VTGRTLDLTQPFGHNAAYNPDLPLPRVEIVRWVIRDGFSLEEMQLCTHVGTHMDAPSHVFADASSVSDYPVERFRGTGVAVDVRDLGDAAPITADVLSERAGGVESGNIVLLLTGWCALRGRTERYTDASPWVDATGARWLVERGVQGVAIDHFSISGRGAPEKVLPAHHILLEAGCWIVEDALLPDDLLSGGPWTVVALPWRITGASGAPTRMIAFEETS